MEWFGYELSGVAWVGPVLGTFVFAWGGWPFLAGAVAEVRDRAPGMMLLIAMAITVAWTASMATSLGWFDLEFWWELALLVTIMLLGHWQEMQAIGQAQGALAALAALLPDEAEVVHGDGTVERVPTGDLQVGDLVLVRPGGRVPADGRIVDGEAELDESMITGESRPVPRGPGDRVVAGTVSTDSSIRVRVDGRRRRHRAGRHPAPRGRGPGQPQPRPGARRPVRRGPLLRRRRRRPAHVRGLDARRAGRRGGAQRRQRPGDRLPARPRPGHPARGRALHGGRRPATGSWSRTAWPSSACGRSTPCSSTRPAPSRRATTPWAGSSARTCRRPRCCQLAAAVEADSEHPLARAIVAAAGDGDARPRASEFRALTGRGVEAVVDGTRYAVGGPALLRQLGLELPDDLRRARRGLVGQGRGRALPRPRAARSSGRWPWRTRSVRKRPRPSPTSTAWASTTS